MSMCKRRKCLLSLMFIGLVVLGQATCIYASAYEWGGLGSRAQSMGGAFIGLADDWTAIYWNPAGLTQLNGKGWGFEFYNLYVVSKDGSSLSNLLPANMDTRYQMDTFAQYNGLEPTQLNEDKAKIHIYNPTGLGTYWQHENLVMAAGFYTPVGNYFDFEDTISYGTGTIKGELFQKLGLMAGNISVAKRIDNGMSFGAGLELLYGEFDYDAKKDVVNSGISDYSWALDSKASGIGFEGIIGCLFSITDTLNLGAVYRTGGRVDLKGDADSHLTLTGLTEKSDYNHRFYHPSTWGLGLALKPGTNLVLTADWQRTNWSETRIDVDYDVEGALLTDKDYSTDWHDSNRYRIGLEYMPTKKWSLRAGYFFDECPLPEKSVSFSNIVSVDRQNVTLGIGHNYNDNWSLDFIYLYAWGKRKANGVEYSQKINCFCMSLLHRF